jgi:aspartyl-tRNA(Asn)/glutamyl-tRNA(Gln) amidotransferase subunit A
MDITEHVASVSSGKVSAVSRVMGFSEKIATDKVKDLNIVLSLNEEAISEAKAIDLRIKEGRDVGKLAGVCFFLKSNICYRSMEANCASLVLEGFVAPYHATVVQKLLSEDAILLGMVNMDEFACGVSGETSAYGPTKNPKNPDLIPGGSSSGSAAAVAADLCDFALGSDTGGSIRNPASHCGVVGVKPSYGLVSRYGLIDMCMSFDCIGPLAHSVADGELITQVISGQDHFDTTTVDVSDEAMPEKGVLGVVNSSKFTTPEIAALFTEKVEALAASTGKKIKYIDLPLDIALETYYILVYTEFFSGTRKYDGRRFGKAIDEFGGLEVARRIIGGSEVTRSEFEGRYYHKALKAKNFILKQVADLFTKVDAILLPTVPKLPHKIGADLSVEEMYAYDVFTVIANISGVAAMSVPMGKVDGLDVGIQVMAPRFGEKAMFDLAKKV